MRFQFWLRSLCILTTAAALTAAIILSAPMAAVLGLAVVLFYQVLRLLHAMERPRRDLIRFFESIEYSDFTQSFSSSSRDASLQPLAAAFDRVIQAFQRARAEKEGQYRYLQTIVQHVGIGLIVFNDDGKIDLVNPLAKKILDMPQLKNIDQLSSLNKDFPDTLRRIESGGSPRIQVAISGATVTLSIHATRFILQNESLTLVSIQNIQSELEEKELEAWQNLIRVLTHEIMNSITPIASLASTAHRLMQNASPELHRNAELHESMDDVTQAIATIESRSQGLLKFVEAYRKLTRVPPPEFEIVSVRKLFDRVVPLMQTKFDERLVRFTSCIEPETLEITADPNLVEQVLINLLQNALDWAGSKPGGEVRLNAVMGNGGRTEIQVTDNGPGIQKEALDKIFIPFFTTKPDGSGIGLSLSRQIMQMHHASISAVSETGQPTTFTLRF